MRLKLWHKFAFALIFTSGLTLFAALYFSEKSFKQGFLAYLNAQESKRINYLAEQLLTDFNLYDDWSFIEDNPPGNRKWHRYLRTTFRQGIRQGLFPELDGRAGLEINRRRHDKSSSFDRPPKRSPRRSSRPPSPQGEQSRRPPPQQGSPGQDRRPRPPNDNWPPPPPRPDGVPPLLNIALENAAGEIVVGAIDHNARNIRFPLRLGKQIIGQLIVKTIEQFSTKGEQEFVKQQRNAFINIAGLALLLTSLLAWLFGRLFYSRIKPLSQMAHLLTSGDFTSKISNQSTDEIGQLANDLDQLASTLDKNRGARQRWIADISHELRTPLSVLQGELEALQDGIRPINSAAIDSLQNEVSRLNHLVEDLYQLSMSDVGALSYQFERLDLTSLIEQEINALMPQFADNGIRTKLLFDTNTAVYINADLIRLCQLLKNLSQNTLRYTDSPGQLQINLRHITVKQQAYVELCWIDSAPSVAPEALEEIFERMSRTENSRNRATGGAGLGLAIVKEIVHAHQAEVIAKISKLGGLTIQIRFPNTIKL